MRTTGWSCGGYLQLEVLELLAFLEALAEQRAERLHVVDGVEPGDELLHAVAQAVIGRRHAGEHGVAADRRQLRWRTQDGRHRRLGAKGLVGMPDIGAEGRSGFVVAKLDQLRRVLALVRRERMHGQLAEAPAEVHQRLGCDVLIAQDDYFVLDQGGFDRLELRFRERPAKVDTGNLRSQIDPDAPHGDGCTLRDDRPCHARIDALVHGTILRQDPGARP